MSFFLVAPYPLKTYARTSLTFEKNIFLIIKYESYSYVPLPVELAEILRDTQRTMNWSLVNKLRLSQFLVTQTLFQSADFRRSQNAVITS